MNEKIAAVIIIFSLLLCVLAITSMAAMFISIKKRGDERRKMIVEKSCANTLFITLIYLGVTSVLKILMVFAADSDFDINPITTMTIISVIYLLQVCYYKRKYGD